MLAKEKSDSDYRNRQFPPKPSQEKANQPGKTAKNPLLLLLSNYYLTHTLHAIIIFVLHLHLKTRFKQLYMYLMLSK